MDLSIACITQLSLSSERHVQGLVMKVRDFYLSERLYLLQTVRQIITFWPEQEAHPYRVLADMLWMTWNN